MGKEDEDKRLKLKKAALRLLVFLMNLREMGLKVNDWLNNVVIPTKAHQIEKSIEFFVQIRLGSLINVREMLQDNRYFIYQMDSVGKTPLHRACNKNNEEIVEL